MDTDTSVFRETDSEGLHKIDNSEKEFTSTMKVHLQYAKTNKIPRESMLT